MFVGVCSKVDLENGQGWQIRGMGASPVGMLLSIGSGGSRNKESTRLKKRLAKQALNTAILQEVMEGAERSKMDCVAAQPAG